VSIIFLSVLKAYAVKKENCFAVNHFANNSFNDKIIMSPASAGSVKVN